MATLPQTFRRARTLTKIVAGAKLDPMEMLQLDHMKVEAMFLQIGLFRTGVPRQRLFARIKRELSTHSQLEEQIFYAACEVVEELEPLIREAREEHAQFKRLLVEMPDFSRKNETGEAKLRLLMEDVRHHVREEENTLFPRVRDEISPSRLEKIAQQMRAFQQEHAPKRVVPLRPAKRTGSKKKAA